MKQNLLLLALFLVSFQLLYAQNVGIGTATPNASAKLDVTDANRGVLIPRVSIGNVALAAPVTAPATSLLVYNTNAAVTGGAGVGFYYWSGTAWVKLDASNGDWKIVGNAGTVAGTNFIGTTDAQAFVVKTGGAAAANERMRFLAGGTASYNNVTPFAGDVFSVYGTGYAGAINALGTFAVNGYVGANGTAVFGESNAATVNNGIGVWGNLLGTQTATGNSSFGVFGRNTTVPQGTGMSFGVAGEVTATAGDARGVSGTTSSPAGIGVAAFNNATTGAAYGVYGQSASVAGISILGINTAAAYSTNTAVGVFGRTVGTVTTGFSIGVRALADAPTGANVFGFYAQSLSSAGVGGIAFVTSTGTGWHGQNAGTGDGVRGINTNATPASAGSGVFGQTNATTAFGGEFANLNAVNGTGLYTAGNGVAGTYLTTGSGASLNGLATGALANATQATNGVGLYGRSNGAAILGVTGGAGVSGSSTLFGVSGFSTSATNGVLRAGGYFETNAGQSFAYVGARTAGNVVRKIEGNGTVNTTVRDINDKLVVLSCPEAPENFFQDYGTGQLVNGRAQIVLDPTFSKNIVVNDAHPLRVFIQLEGDCNGVYVTSKSQLGFEVVELSAGRANVPFSWTVTANRADEVLSDGSISKYSEERFAPAMGPQTTTVVSEEAFSKRKQEELIRNPIKEEQAINILPTSNSELVEKRKELEK